MNNIRQKHFISSVIHIAHLHFSRVSNVVKPGHGFGMIELTNKHEADVIALANSTGCIHDIVPHLKNTHMEQLIVREHQANDSEAFIIQHLIKVVEIYVG